MDIFKISQIQPEDLGIQKDPAGALRALRPAGEGEDTKKLKHAARQFEGLLVQLILKQMKETTSELEADDEDGGDVSREHLKSMFWTFLGDSITEQGGFGLWEQVYQQTASAGSSEPAAGTPDLDERI